LPGKPEIWNIGYTIIPENDTAIANSAQLSIGACLLLRKNKLY
jgi:hypothetical protein